MGSYTRNTWTDALAKHAHDLDALYYYLQINPWLMSPVQERPRTACARRKRSRCDVLVKDSDGAQGLTTHRQLEDEIRRLRDENAALKKANQQKRRRFFLEATTIVANVALLLVGVTNFSRPKI